MCACPFKRGDLCCWSPRAPQALSVQEGEGSTLTALLTLEDQFDLQMRAGGAGKPF